MDGLANPKWKIKSMSERLIKNQSKIFEVLGVGLKIVGGKFFFLVCVEWRGFEEFIVGKKKEFLGKI